MFGKNMEVTKMANNYDNITYPPKRAYMPEGTAKKGRGIIVAAGIAGLIAGLSLIGGADEIDAARTAEEEFRNLRENCVDVHVCLPTGDSAWVVRNIDELILEYGSTWPESVEYAPIDVYHY